MNRGTSEKSETSGDEYLTRWIQLFQVHFCLGIILKVILKKEVKNKQIWILLAESFSSVVSELS